MFNTNEMDQRRDEYINHRLHLAERDTLARIAKPQRPAFSQRFLAVIARLWQQRPSFNNRKALTDHTTSAKLTSNALRDVS